MIHAFVVYCLVLNPTMCQTLEIAPVDGHRIASAMECMRGGMMGSSGEFTYQGAQWRIKGLSCREEPSEVQAWLNEHR